MAENKTININIKQNADKAEKSFKSYNKELGNTKKQYDAVLKSGKPFDQQLEDINRIVKETPLNVRDMNKQIQAYQSIALSAGRETPVGRKALEEAAALRDRYIDIQNETKRLADDQRTLEGAMQGVATGVAVYGGIQSAMALSGVESEKLRETLVKLQAAQTLMNSINQVATAFEKESALMLTLKAARTKALTAATAAYAAVTGTTTGLLKAFRIALASTGIGLLVVGIGLLIANFDKLMKPFTLVIDAFKALGDAIGLTNFATDEYIEASKKQEQASVARRNAIDKEIEALDRQIDRERKLTSVKLRQIELDKAEAQSTDEVIKLQQEATEEKIKLNDKEYDNFIANQIKKLEAHKEEAKILQGIIDRNIARGRSDHKSELEQLEARQKHISKLKVAIVTNNFDFYTENQVAREEIEKEGEKAIDKIRKDANNKYQTYLQNRLSAERKIEDIQNAMMKDGIEKELEINRDKFRRLREDAKKNTKLTREERNKLIALYEEQGQKKAADIRAKYRQKEIEAERKLQQQLEAERNAFEDEIAAIQEANYKALLTDEERELRAVQDKYFRLQELAKGNADALNEIEIARLNEENEINLKYQNEAYEAQKALDEQTKADALATQQAKIQFANDALGAIGELANAFAGESEKSQRRAFKINKAVGIAQAVINTAGAISAAINPAVGGLGIPAGLPGAILAGATGAAQIATIAKTQFEGGSTGDVSSPSETGLGAAVTPEFNVVGDSGVNQLAQLQQTPTQAFVVSGEVTSAQALDRNRVTNATL